MDREKALMLKEIERIQNDPNKTHAEKKACIMRMEQLLDRLKRNELSSTAILTDTKSKLSGPKKIYKTEEQIQEVFNNIERFEVKLDSVDYKKDLVIGFENIIICGPHRSGTTFVR